MTRPPRRPLPGWVTDVPLAHRGLWSAHVPENSMAAFAAARDAGVGVELDVHLTADGVPVVTHDANLIRATGVDVALSSLPLAALVDHPIADGTTIPTLAAVLDELAGAPTMVELKNHRRGAGVLEPPVAEVLDAHAASSGGGEGSRAYVASFHPGSLRWFRRNRPMVLRAQTASAASDPRLPAIVGAAMGHLALNGRSLPHLLSYDVAHLDHPAVRRWRRRGGVVLAWTVRDEATLSDARHGADNIIFESIDPRADRSGALTDVTR